MSNIPDENKDIVIYALLIFLIVTGAIFLVKPATVTLDAFANWVEMFPDPNTLGPNGALMALVAMILGLGGYVRKSLS